MLRGYIPLHLYVSNSCAEYLPGTFPMLSGHIRGSIIMVDYVRDALWLYSRVDHGTINRNGCKLRGCCKDVISVYPHLRYSSRFVFQGLDYPLLIPATVPGLDFIAPYSLVTPVYLPC